MRGDPLPVISQADQAILRQLVGEVTFTRAWVYARRGAVRRWEWEEPGRRVVGEVQGTASRPYRVSAELTRSPSEMLAALETVCTCPVGHNCKHAVALLLVQAGEALATPADGQEEGRRGHLRLVTPTGAGAPSARSPARGAGDGHGSPGPAWEGSLRPLLEEGGPGRAAIGESGLGLQLELVPDRPGGGARAGGPGIRVRPVQPGRAGSWVRSGISWSSLDYAGYGRSKAGAPAKIELLKELLGLSRLGSGRPYYGYREEAVWLEGITSRRLWDLLREAEDLELPLLGTGRHAGPVDLRSSPAEATVDVVRAEGGLRLRPYVDAAPDEVSLASSLLIGKPAHGIAWWEGSPTAGGASRLHLAPFARPLPAAVRRLLESDPLLVPEKDEERFLRDYYPALRRRTRIRSGDGSVALPEVPESALILSLRHGAGHRVELSWSVGVPGTAWQEELWGAARGARDRLVEDAISSASTIVGGLPVLLQPSPFGDRLAGAAELEGVEAARFVTAVLPALVEVEGLEVEESGAAPDYREATAAPVVRLGGQGSEDGDWLDLAVEVSVGGEEVPFQELFVALAEERPHLLLPSGTYFSLDQDELHRLKELIAEARGFQDSLGDRVRVSRFQASLWEDLQGLGVVAGELEAWTRTVRALAGATERVEHPAPRGLEATLRPYQHAGFNWLAFLYEHRLGGILADEMGLGKTLQALALMCHAREEGLATSPFLVVAPTSVVEGWAAECRRFAPGLRPLAIEETTARRGVGLAEITEGTGIVITSYALFRLDYEEYAELGWAGLFLDEAQFVKNPASQAYRRARSLPAPFKVAMTGTPMENNLLELWSLLSITAPGLFPHVEHFSKHYRVPVERQGDAERLALLRRRVRPLMLRRTKEQVVAELPDKQEQVLELELSPRHKRLYQTYLHRERQKVLGLLGDLQKNRFEIFRSLTLLRQASLDISLVDPAHGSVPSAKLDALAGMLEEIVADGHRVLVFSQFTRFLALARRRLASMGIEHCYLDGRTRNRAEVIAEFRRGDAPAFLISLKAGGFGLNLTEADYCVLLDPWWNPATEAQAVDRAHRIGQTRKVMVYRLVAKDTVEEKVMALKARKAALFADVMDGGGFESGALTAADIRGLLE